MLALENEPNLVTLELKNCLTSNHNQQTDSDAAAENIEFTYGDEDLNGKTLQL